MGVIIIDSHSYIPDNIVYNDFYEKKFNLKNDWVSKRTGIISRHLATSSEATSDLAVNAIRPLLARNKEPIDFIICATSTPDSLLPSTANQIGKKLGLNESLFCFDIMAACSGFLYALAMANAFIKSGMYQSGIIVGADKMSAIINQNDPYTSPLFGDGAGAFLLKRSCNKEKGILASILGSDNSGTDKLFIKAGGSETPLTIERLEKKENYVTMKGKDVFIHAISRMTSMIEDVLKKNNISMHEVDYIIPHQANKRITDAVSEKIGLPNAKMCNIIENHGNIVNASIPVAYHLFQKQIGTDKNIVMVAFGAGFNYGAHYLRT